MPTDHSPNQEPACAIDWRPWDRFSFAAAAENDTPLLLVLATGWCRWCRQLEQTSLADQSVIERIRDGFVPVRVDPEERPDIGHRYSMGGWPTIAVLTPEAEVVTGTTFLAPNEMLEMLENASGLWRDYRQQIAEEVAELRMNALGLLDRVRANPDAIQLDEVALASLLDTALLSFDERNAGFGSGAKFPRADILSALLALVRVPTQSELLAERQGRAREIIGRTLDAVANGGLWDQIDGGFFRYAAAPDWTGPHTEKTLVDNASLTRLFAKAGSELGRTEWIGTALACLEYIERSLLSPGGLYSSSRIADDEYYSLPRDTRSQCRPPGTIPAQYSGGNAMAGRALVAVAQATGDAKLWDRATDVSDLLWERRSDRDLVGHAGAASPDCFLDDQTELLALLLDLAEMDPEPDRGFAARERAEDFWADIDRYFSVSGRSVLLADTAAPADVPQPSLPFYEARLGRLSRTETPLPQNSLAAACLVRLARLNGDASLLDRAALMLDQLGPYATYMGNFAIDLAHAGLILRGA